jgi:hypothetical protein
MAITGGVYIGTIGSLGLQYRMYIHGSIWTMPRSIWWTNELRKSIKCKAFGRPLFVSNDKVSCISLLGLACLVASTKIFVDERADKSNGT